MLYTKHVAKAFVYDSNGHILLLRRSDTHPHYALHADLPGGEVEPHEEPLEAVIREVFEETGLQLAPETIMLMHTEPASSGTEYMLFEARVPHVQPSVVISWEHDLAEWLSADEVIRRGQTGDGYDDYYTMAVERLLASTSATQQLSTQT